MGESAPGHLQEQVFLEVGGWCTSNTTHIDPYGSFGSCSESASDNYQVATDLEWYLYGYETSTTHTGHTGQQSLTLVATTNNSVAGSDTTNADAQGKDWEKAINTNLRAYADYLNNYNKSHSYSLRFYVEGGNDLEGGFGGPGPGVSWVRGFNSVDSAGIAMTDNGGYLGTCADKSCWNTPVDHGWSASQKYYTNWGATYDYGFPEIYDTGWPVYYKDLDSAAASVGANGSLPYGVPGWTGTMWGCGTGGSEPNPDQAWADFVNGVGKQPPFSTYIHSLSKSC